MEQRNYEEASRDYQLIEQAILYLEAHYQEQPSLKEVAGSVNLSEYHFQRLFRRWVGISPKRFLQYLTKEQAKELLAQSYNVLDVTYATGLTSPGRLHDLFVNCEAVTPGEYKNQGEGMSIVYGYHPTPFGECLLALTERGVCNLIFVQDMDRRGALASLRGSWKNAELRQSNSETQPVIEQIFSLVQGDQVRPFNLFLRGTNFQIQVWQALLRIPIGSVVTYESIANSMGMPGAARAVGNAVGRNPLAVIVPCHRVIRKVGEFGNYRYGTARKKALLGWEFAHQEYASVGAD